MGAAQPDVDAGDAIRLNGASVTAGFFPLLGVAPLVVLVFAVTALVASYLPARRATRVDPAVALRAE